MQLLLHSIPTCATYTVAALWAGQLRNCGPISDRFRGFFVFFKATRQAMRHTKLSIQRVQAAHPPEVKQMGHETDHSLPSSTKVHNYSAQTSTPAPTFIAYTIY